MSVQVLLYSEDALLIQYNCMSISIPPFGSKIFFFFFGSRATCHLCPDHYIILYNVGLLGRVLGCGTHSTISSDENQNLTSEISTECEPLPDLPVV